MLNDCKFEKILSKANTEGRFTWYLTTLRFATPDLHFIEKLTIFLLRF